MLPEGPLFHKPTSIIAAMNILYATLFLGVINWAIGQWGTDFPGGRLERTIVMVVMVIIIFGLIKMIGLGKKWTRVVLLVLIAEHIVAYPWTLGPIVKYNLLVGVLSVFLALLQIVALIFLFSQASTQWFNKVHSAAQDL
jgi:hypothetical protein